MIRPSPSPPRAIGYTRFDGRAGRLPPRHPDLVPASLPGRADRPAGARLARDRGRRRHADRGADRLGQDAGGVPRRHRPPVPRRRGRPRRRVGDRGGLRVAAQGAGRRHPGESPAPTGGDPGGGPGARAGGPGPPRRRPDGGQLPGRSRGDAPATAAPPDHHARVPVPPRHRRPEPRAPPGGAHRDRGRDPRGGAGQARVAPGLDAGAPGRAREAAAPAHRAVGHPAADRDDRPPPGRGRRGAQPARRRPGVPHRRPRPPPRPRSHDRAAGQRAGSRRIPRAVGGDPGPHRDARARAPDDAHLRQHAASGRADRAPPGGAPRGGPGRRPSRKPVQGSPAPARDPAARGRPGRPGRHGLARARHRHRSRGAGLPDRLPPQHRHLAPAGGPLGPRARAPSPRGACTRRRATSWSR